MIIYKYSHGEYGVYLHLHHEIGKSKPAHVCRIFKRRNHARAFARCHHICHTK